MLHPVTRATLQIYPHGSRVYSTCIGTRLKNGNAIESKMLDTEVHRQEKLLNIAIRLHSLQVQEIFMNPDQWPSCLLKRTKLVTGQVLKSNEQHIGLSLREGVKKKTYIFQANRKGHLTNTMTSPELSVVKRYYLLKYFTKFCAFSKFCTCLTPQ